ncbi:cadherin-like beta sandwich domain-containing protein [Mucilaginibacter sp. ZT4R22]|uniref:Cadherin-like beta sandwich domain-containing protein n=1 Tax=Mucilaginibacter pankratovii TaxID=2772110 RepID=A0ABR7WLT9_9SPHI|nr:cadherin-like beta sandwich domain-containing protein [Mucilaginibacter pankratovii]MBD1362329.1 cadherin-like beta sandwich domain-containing protein [Mucilaginibacter pankratovii]
MKRILLLLKSNLQKGTYAIPAAFLLLVLLTISTAARAQVVYTMGETASSSPTATDVVNRMNYNGTGGTTVATGLVSGLIQPGNIALDGNNNRIFVSDLYTPTTAIKVLNATTGAVIRTISSTNSKAIRDIAYDVAGDWLYYITEGGSITVNDAGDAVYRVHADGTGTQTVATSITKNPYRVDVDAAGSKVYVLDVSFSGRALKTIDLANSNAVTSRSFATSAPSVYDFAVDKVNGYIYYLTENSSAATLAATDALRRQNLDGTNDVALVTSIANTPFRLALDAGNNRAYVGDAYNVTAKIIAVNLNDNTYSTVINLPQGSTAAVHADIAVPEQPQVTTTAASSITATGATLAGNLVYGYGMSTERGVVYSSTNSTPTVSDTKAANATVSTNGAYSASVTGLSPSTTYYARAYAVNGAGTTYGAVTTFSTQSNDANLSAFTISSGTLSPVFAAGTTSYTASVTNATTSITVTPTRNQANATIKVNNTAVTSGSASGSISLNIGSNTITTVVTAQDASTKTYTLTVTRPKAAQTITFNAIPAKTYGNADFAPGATASSGLTVSYVSSNTAVATIVSGQIHIVGAGTSTITASQAGDASNFAASDVTQTLTVNKNAITVTPSANQTKVYGNADPASYSYTITSGTLKSGDVFTGALTRAAGSDVGTYAITIGTLSLGNNYTLTAANGDFNITKRPLEITPTVQTKAYGDNDPASYTYSFTSGTSLASSDGMSGPFVRATGEIPGVYAFSIGTKHPVNATTGVDATSNYTVTFVSTNLTITKRLITLKPVPATKVYGNADPTYPYQFVVGSVAPGEGMTGTFGRAAGEDVGAYALTLGTKRPVNASTGVATDQYYTISFISDNLTITKRTVNVSANAQSKTYGDADPSLTYNADALGFSDTFSGTLTRAAGQSIGTYAISQGTLALNTNNYTLNFTGANLTIGKKTVNVTADAKTKSFGDSDPALTYTADALASGDSFSGAITRAAGESFGTYAISQGTLAVSNSSNYTLNFTGANLTINKKTINVTAAAKSKTYGDSDPALTYTADALIGGDSFTGAITRDAGESFGTYAINQGSLTLSSNYTLNYTGANLSIGKRAIDIYSGSRDVQYGDPDGVIGYSYSGTPVAGDTFSGALGREPGTALGTYATTIGAFQISNGSNYDLIFHSAPFNIIQREIIVSGGSTFKIYGDADPAINYSIYSGTLLGGTQITGALTRDAGETAGPYNVSLGTLAINDSNYKLTFQGGYFEIDRAPLTLTIGNKTKVATKPNPALTYSVSGYKNGDTEATAFTSAIQLTTDATINSGAGDYNIYPVGGVTATNYNITQVGGTMTVTPASSVNTLASATLNGGGFDTPFDPETDFYSVNIPNGSTSATLIATVTDPLSTMSIGAYPEIATPVASGTPYTISFSNNNTEQVGVHVTAENGSIKSYYFNVNPIPSDSKLSNLGSSVGIIAPSFNPLVTSYSLNVSAETESVIITPTTHDPAAKARVNGGAGGGGEGGSSYGAKTVLLYEGPNYININVKSADNTGNTFYTLVINRPITLAGLAISAGTLSPAFDPTVTTYTAKVPESVPSITITPSARQDFYQLLVNGEYVSNNTASAPITIGDGAPTVITTKITAGDGETSKTYTINAVHASSNADLAGISLSTGALDPVFDAATLTYNVYLPNSTTAVSFTPTLANANATMTVNAAPAASGAAITLNNLSVGLHNYYIVVTAEDGVVTKTYTLSITRPPSSEPGLANITLNHGSLSPAFNPTADPNYSVTLPAGVESVDMSLTLLDTTASLQARLNGHSLTIPNQHLITVPVNALYNTLILTSTAQDGTTVAIYTITLERPISTDATLSALTTSIGTFTTPFNSAATAYDVVVPDETININLTPVATSGFATIKVNGVPLAKGFSSQSLPVSASVNNYPIEVTAESGAIKTIAVRVIKATATNPSLASLTISAGTLSPVFDKDVVNYATTVAYAITSITLTPTSVDPSATIKVNGNGTTSGAASASIALLTGPNTIPVEVTATDGSSVKTYTVTVIRTGSSNTGLNSMTINPGVLTRVGTSDNYTTSVSPTASSVQLTLATKDPATIKVDGVTTAQNTASAPVALIGTTTTFPVEITAEDGVTTRVINITVNKTGSNNTGLGYIAVSSGPVTRVGTSNNWTTIAISTVNSVQITLGTKDPATIKINGVITAQNTASAPVTLTGAATAVPVEITAEDGVTKLTFSITVNKIPSSNTGLNSMTINPGVLTRVGTSDNYTSSVGNSVNSVRLTLGTKDPGTIKVNGVSTAQNTASAPVTLTGAATTFPVEITAEDGVTTRVLNITVNKTGSNNTALNYIAISSGAVTRVGTSDNWTSSVSNSVNSVQLTLGTKDPATIKINGVTTDQNTASAPITLIGVTTAIPVEITAEDGVTTLAFTVTVNKTGSNNTGLSTMTISPGVLTRIGTSDNYTSSVSFSVNSVQLTLGTKDPGTIKVNGVSTAQNTASAPITLTGPTTTFPVEITAEDGVTTRVLNITVNKTGSNNTALNFIAVSSGPISRVGTSDNWTASASSTLNTVQITLGTKDPATIKINGVSTDQNTASAPVTLIGVSTAIPVEITAEDGVTTLAFTITVNRTGSNNTGLSSMSINPGVLTRVGTSDNYTSSVSNSVNSVELTLGTKDPATIKVNGVATAQNTASAPVTLTGAATTFPVEITAEDGVTTRVINITVNKTGSNNTALNYIAVSSGPITRVGTSANWVSSAGNSVNSVQITLGTKDPATIKVNGVTTAQRTASAPLTLAGTATVIPIEITAEDGVTTLAFTITVNRTAPPVIAAVNKNRNTIDVLQKPEPSTDVLAIDLVVKQAVSPNGDGINDRLTIQGINAFPENTVRIMNRNGDVVYEARGYDNESKAFDGHSSKGTLQQAGTYFYSVEYKKGTETKRKTGYIVVKY